MTSSVHDLCVARNHLDIGDDLNIKELALLAAVDERTIRNSASSKDENSLNIKKSGGSTIVENSEAIRWLSRRPDFKQTQYVENDLINSPRFFKDEVGFGNFITFKRNELNLTLEAVANFISVDLDVIADLEKGIDRLYLNQVGKLAEILEEDSTVLVRDYMRIFHVNELASLLGVCSLTDDTDNLNYTIQLAFFKAKLNTEAELEVLKWQQKRTVSEQNLSD